MHDPDPIDRWWAAFAKQAPRFDALFSQREDWDLPEWMHEHLAQVNEQLMWEFGPALKGDGHRLVITPESARHLRPLVSELIAQAPAIDGWEFYEYRIPETMENIPSIVEARGGGSIDGVQCQIVVGDYNCINVTYIQDQFSAESESDLHTSFVLTESLLGEELLDRWVGSIDVSPAAVEGGGEMFPLQELQDRFSSELVNVVATLPELPWYEREIGEEWSGYQLDPEEADDYPGQEDLIAGITADPNMVENILAGVPFDSIRYSAHNELFCFLKIDSSDGMEETGFPSRSDLEEAIDAKLRPAGLGAVIGGGSGRRYAYVELALTDVPEAWDVIADLLEEASFPDRTWLLHHDDDLKGLWYGLYEDTPEPPGTEQD